MSEKNPTPLDFDEVISPEKEIQLTPWQKRLLTLEMIPLILLATGLLMSRNGHTYADTVLKIGGLSSAVLYLFFSWYMFKVGSYRPLEVVLSILCGLVFPIGFLGILFVKESWPYGYEALNAGIYGGLGLAFVSIVLFAFHLKDKRATVFYRNIIARLLIFSMLLLYLGRVYL